MHDVVVSAVRKAVSAATIIFTASSIIFDLFIAIIFNLSFGYEQKPIKPLSEKDTLVRVLTPFVVILLVCKHPASLPTNTVIPFRDFFSSRKNQENRLYT